VNLKVADDPAQAARAAAELIFAAIAKAREQRGVAHIALAGGSTPRPVYELLAAEQPGWESVHLWFGDERAVPPDDPESNYRLVRDSLLRSARAPEPTVHRIDAEQDPEAAAQAYERELRALLPARDDGVPVLDLAVLGVGEDGHTASLFSGDPLLTAEGPLCRAVIGPKPPPRRITLTLPVLRAARQVVLLATGEGKAAAIRAILAGPDPAVPASLVAGENATLIIDRAAAPPLAQPGRQRRS
jgi:6-phosphogluconolactonase